MKCLLLLPLALLAAAPPQDLEQRVRDLVSQLEDDSIERREKAAADLLLLGKPAAAPLRAFLEKTDSAEAKGRIADILHRLEADLRRREFKGGEAVSGLSAALHLQGADSTTLVLEVEFMNVGEEDRPLYPIRMWDRSLPGDHFVSNLSEAFVEVKQVSGDRPKNVRRGRL